MSTIAIKNAAVVVTMDPEIGVLQDATVLIQKGRIVEVGKAVQVPEDAVTFDAKNSVVYPGFVNTHHHFYQSLFRGVPEVQSAKLFDWLTYLYPMWAKIDPDILFAASRLAIAELLLSGCTTTSDHHYLFPAAAPGDLIDAEFEAATEMGIRFLGTRGSMSRGESKGGLPPDSVVQTESEILKDSVRVIDKWHDPSTFSMTRVALAPCSPFSVTTDLMQETAALARDKHVRLHTHLAETMDEEEYCQETYGMRPLAYMESTQWLGEDVWFAHGVYFTDEELRLLAQTRTGIAHCPVSNLRLGSGIARVPQMLDLGVPVGLGVDGSASNDSSNMLHEIQTELLVHRVKWGVDSMDVNKVLYTATKGGAQVLGWDRVGQLTPGWAADLSVWRLDTISSVGFWDPVAALVMGGRFGAADLVIVNGKVLVQDGRLTGIDHQGIVNDAKKAIRKLKEN